MKCPFCWELHTQMEVYGQLAAPCLTVEQALMLLLLLLLLLFISWFFIPKVLKLAVVEPYDHSCYDGDFETVNMSVRHAVLKHWIATEIRWYRNAVSRWLAVQNMALLPVSIIRMLRLTWLKQNIIASRTWCIIKMYSSEKDIKQECFLCIVCIHVQASKAAFHELIQVDADSVWLILNDVYCPHSPIVSTDDTLPPVHVIHSCLFSPVLIPINNNWLQVVARCCVVGRYRKAGIVIICWNNYTFIVFGVVYRVSHKYCYST